MRKMIASVLIGTLLVLPAPVLAASNRVNVEKLAFDKIDEHISSYNYQVYTSYDSLDDIEVPADADKTALEGMLAGVVNQIAVYDSKIDKLGDPPFPDDNTEFLLHIYNELKAISQTNKTNLESQINSFNENQDKASDAKSDATLKVEAGKKQIIWGAEQMYLSYNSLEHQIKQQSNQLYLLEKQLYAMELREKLGLVSNVTYKGMEKNIKELRFAVSAMRDQQTSLKEQLNVMLNQNYDTALVIEETPVLDTDLLDNMNLEEDYKKAEPLSFDARQKEDSWEREAEERKFEQAFKKSFENVKDKKDSLELEEYKLETERIVTSHAELRYKLGLISRMALKEQQYTFENQRLKVQVAKEELYKAYRQYEWMKEGLTL